jgi:uncharacterized protein (DUF1800 family)
MSLAEFLERARDEGRSARGDVKEELKEAVLLRAVTSKRQFREVVAEFWRNHFNVDVNKVPFLATHYEEHALRPHAFGKFEDLLLAVAKHPAMLVYLDNYVSTRRGVNENYARELMELHTLGVDNGYTQKDVEALARVLTGWTCGWRGKEYRFYFNADAHDPSPATVVGLKLPGTGGAADGEAAIRHLARHPGTVQFLATKLCRYFVSDTPPPALVDRVAKVFLDTGGDLPAVYRAIVFSPEFISPKAYRAKFKTPFEFTVSALRATDAKIESPRHVFRRLALMGQPVYEHVEPTGYSDLREAWLDPGVMLYRWNFAIELVTDKAPGVAVGPAFAERVLKAAPADRPRRVAEAILPGESDARTRQMMAATADVRAVVAYALGSPSFQQH